MRAIKGAHTSESRSDMKQTTGHKAFFSHGGCQSGLGWILAHGHGVSDSAVKQILLSMNEKDPFIIEDLDEYHLIIKADEEYRVRKELEAEVRTPPSPRRYSFSGSFYLAGKKYIQLGSQSMTSCTQLSNEPLIYLGSLEGSL